GIARFSNSAMEASLPDFMATYFALGWGIGCRLPLSLSWQNGISVGSFRMSFDDEQTESATRNEQELALGLRSSLQCPLGKRWSLDFSGQYLAVMTHVRIQHLLVSVGVSRSFTTPQWLEDFLR
ncbi:MAG: hypothetical protein KAY24_12445, partial [Candidatus Eisenbacteria sp.]|nr:hypothetical protein [Candidatus Eisenbacteria bacterium]